MVRFGLLTNFLGKDKFSFSSSFKDDPSKTGGEVTFLGRPTSIDNLLEICGYSQIDVNIPVHTGSLFVLANQFNFMGIYLADG